VTARRAARPRCAGAWLVGVWLAGAAPAVAAQDQEAEPPERARRWTGRVAASGNLFFGNVDQLLLGSRLALARADSDFALRFDGQHFYGEAQDDAGDRAVTKRSVLSTVTADWLPYDRWSPFIFGTAESSFERRIRGRYSGGVGAKRTYLRTAASEASLSGALLYERTDPRGIPTQPLPGAVTRLSWRARARHDFGPRTRVAHVTFWRPDVRRLSRYLVLSTTEASYALTRHTTVSLSFVDTYDSDARSRGARAYNDGQLLFGVATDW
jgi:hypothetical protein